MKKLIIALTAIGFALPAVAQSTGELLRFSQYDFSNATARSAAMAGAYTSMGADLSSMSINPAGLAMYSSSEVSVTGGINIAATYSDYGSSNANLASRVKATVPQLGAAFKVGDFTIAFGFNRLADFSSKMDAQGNYELFNSKARIWADQITGIPASQFAKEFTMFNRNPVLWNGVMGYDSYLIDPATTDPGNTSYGLWGIINPDDMIRSSLERTTNGAINEMTLSGAWDFKKILYVGMTMGFQSIRYEERSFYGEYNNLNRPDINNVGVMNSFSTLNNLTMSGFGFNLKLGATVRPLPWLRIGVAYHSPTWITIDEVSNADISPDMADGNGRYSYTPDLLQDYRLQTPGRLLAGVSATIARRVILSFDYERAWYRDMFYNTPINLSGWREGAMPNDIDNLPNISSYTDYRGNMRINDMVADNYRATSNYRVGLEVQPVDKFFIRAGFAYNESPYSDKVESTYAEGTKLSDYGAITRYSGGLGYRSGQFNIEAAYVYSSWNELPGKFFDYVTVNPYQTGVNGQVIAAGTSIASKSNINRKRENHNILLTFSWRF